MPTRDTFRIRPRARELRWQGDRSPMLRLLRFMKPFRGLVALVLLFSFLSTLANLTLPRLLADIVDVGIVQGDTGYIFHAGATMLLVAALGAGCAVAGSFFAAKVATG